MPSLLQQNSDMFGDDVLKYTSLEFLNLLDNHRAYLLNLNLTSTIEVDPMDAWKFSGSLYGYLKDKGYPFIIWEATRIVNNMYSPSDFNDKTKTLVIPSQTGVKNLMETFNKQK